MGITERDRDRAAELRAWLTDGTAREIRERCGWSREMCAGLLDGVTAATIMKWELGRSVPYAKNAARYHRLLSDLRKLPEVPRNPSFGNRGAQRAEVER
ncbi:helix-turn-helix transcriptional regulator [Streptomyces sp. NPDC004232]|uniref:helix-turn-helix domain-containing protein n=1 Tax=Streptomyces sp. NPDC004232 TaxID=3154454 RepID=UPI0033B64DA8